MEATLKRRKYWKKYETTNRIHYYACQHLDCCKILSRSGYKKHVTNFTLHQCDNTCNLCQDLHNNAIENIFIYKNPNKNVLEPISKIPSAKQGVKHLTSKFVNNTDDSLDHFYEYESV